MTQVLALWHAKTSNTTTNDRKITIWRCSDGSDVVFRVSLRHYWLVRIGVPMCSDRCSGQCSGQCEICRAAPSTRDAVGRSHGISVMGRDGDVLCGRSNLIDGGARTWSMPALEAGRWRRSIRALPRPSARRNIRGGHRALGSPARSIAERSWARSKQGRSRRRFSTSGSRSPRRSGGRAASEQLVR